MVAVRTLGAFVAILLFTAGCIGGNTDLDPEIDEPVLALTLVDLPSLVAGHPYRDRETAAAIDPNDADHAAVFYNEAPDTAIRVPNPVPPEYRDLATLLAVITPGVIQEALAVSHDGGATWTRSALPVTGQAPPTSQWNLVCAHGDPNVYIDTDGVVHIVTIAIGCGPTLGIQNGIIHATTADDGRTWSEPDFVWWVPTNWAVEFNDREWTAYDAPSGRVGIAWTKFDLALNRASLTVVFSGDNGATWTLPHEIESSYPITNAQNYVVHTTWDSDGRFHITGNSCSLDSEDPLAAGQGGCVYHYAGGPDGGWTRTDIPIGTCPDLPEGGRFWFAPSTIDPVTRRIYIAADVLAETGPTTGGQYRAGGACLFASGDGGQTWSAGERIGTDSSHPWIGLHADGSPVVSYMALENGTAVPTLAVFNATTLELRETVALGPAFDPDTNDDGALEYGDYDEMATAGGRFLWALTQPNQDGRMGSAGFNDLDVMGYRGTFLTTRMNAYS